ncbi:hypothetical protein LCGC14_1430410 [marine sediment metagenome]|uniref:Uncharacterized protein n=1 Tax=marine sediment metagenome TaxID=412755 RepID=A0A0F9JP36_9ZZZZ
MSEAKKVLDRIREGKFPCGMSQPVCGHFRTIPTVPLEQIAELEDERDGLNVRCEALVELLTSLTKQRDDAARQLAVARAQIDACEDRVCVADKAWQTAEAYRVQMCDLLGVDYTCPEPETSTEVVARMKREIADLKADLALNAAMLARQTDLARQAESDLAAAECLLGEAERGAVQVNDDLRRGREIEEELGRAREQIAALTARLAAVMEALEKARWWMQAAVVHCEGSLRGAHVEVEAAVVDAQASMPLAVKRLRTIGDGGVDKQPEVASDRFEGGVEARLAVMMEALEEAKRIIEEEHFEKFGRAVILKTRTPKLFAALADMPQAVKRLLAIVEAAAETINGCPSGEADHSCARAPDEDCHWYSLCKAVRGEQTE